MTFVIRPAVETDIPFILTGYQYINRNTPMQTTAQLTPQQIKDHIFSDKPYAYINVATYESEVIGFVFYSLVYFASTGINVWVTNLYVDPLGPRPGISSVGKKLIDHILDRHAEVVGIYAVTERTNNAMQRLVLHYGGKVYEDFLFIGGTLRK